MALFQYEIGWKWMRNRENKNFNFISFLHDALPILENFKKIGKKFKK